MTIAQILDALRPIDEASGRIKLKTKAAGVAWQDRYDRQCHQWVEEQLAWL